MSKPHAGFLAFLGHLGLGCLAQEIDGGSRVAISIGIGLALS